MLKIAKLIGVIIFVLNIMGIPSIIQTVLGALGTDNSSVIGEFMLINVTDIVSHLIVGIGLFFTKTWSIYGLFFLMAVNLFKIGFLDYGPLNMLEIIIECGLFFWFISNKKEFSK